MAKARPQPSHVNSCYALPHLDKGDKHPNSMRSQRKYQMQFHAVQSTLKLGHWEMIHSLCLMQTTATENIRYCCLCLSCPFKYPL